MQFLKLGLGHDNRILPSRNWGSAFVALCSVMLIHKSFSRPSPSASTSSATEKTRTQNSASFSSSPASTVSADTTSLSASYPLRGDTRAPRRARLSHRESGSLPFSRKSELGVRNENLLIAKLGRRLRSDYTGVLPMADRALMWRSIDVARRSQWSIQHHLEESDLFQ